MGAPTQGLEILYREKFCTSCAPGREITKFNVWQSENNDKVLKICDSELQYILLLLNPMAHCSRI